MIREIRTLLLMNSVEKALNDNGLSNELKRLQLLSHTADTIDFAEKHYIEHLLINEMNETVEENPFEHDPLDDLTDDEFDKLFEVMVEDVLSSQGFSSIYNDLNDLIRLVLNKEKYKLNKGGK